MKQKIIFLALTLTAFISCKQGRKLKQAEENKKNETAMNMAHTKQELINEVEIVHDNFNKSLSQFNETALNTVPFEGSWTAGQVAEHIIKSNNGILTQLLNGKSKATDRPYDEQLTVVQRVFRSREKTTSAPILEPGPPQHHLHNLLDTLKKQQNQQLKVIKTMELTEISSELKFPPSPDGLTRYEWLHLMLEHANRHKKQMDNIYDKLK